MSDERDPQRATRRHAVLVALLAVAVRAAWLLLVPNLQTSDASWYDLAARQLAQTGVLAYPHGLRAWFPPGWPAFLAAFYWLFGTAWPAFKLVNLVLSGLLAALTVLVGARVFGRAAGGIAGLLLALLPGNVVYVGLAQYEVFLSALVVLVVWLLVADLNRKASSRRPHLVGVALAWATLTRPLLLFLPVVLGCYVRRRAPRREARRFTAIVCLYVVVASMAWSARNLLVLGSPVIFDSHGGYNLWLGNNPLATGGTYALPHTDDPRLNLMAVTDEVARDRAGYTFALGYIAEHPRRFLELVPARIARLYSTDTTGLYLAFLHAPLAGPTPFEPLRRGSALPEQLVFRAYALVMVLAAVGLLKPGWRSPEVQLLGALVAYWTAWTAITIGDDRFHVPIMWIFCIFAGHAAARGALRLRRASSVARGTTG